MKSTGRLAAGVVALVAGQALGVGVSGSLKYTDGAGVAQAARRVHVEIYAANPGGDTLVATAIADDDGNWSADAPSPPGTIGYFMRAVAENDGGRVSADGGAHGYFVDVGGTGPGGGATGLVTIDTTGSDATRAFAVVDAMQTSWLHARTVRGTGPAVLPAVFPETGAGTASFYDGTSVHIRQWRRYAWDVINHEYGHYLADIDHLDANPGGSHSFGASNITAAPGGKLNGVRLAWGEALATYNGTAAQEIAAHPASPTVGDTVYTSLNSDAAGTFAVNLETHAGSLDKGEGDEASVMRILWDLADGTGGTESHDRVTIGHSALYSIIKNDIPGIDQLSGLWNHLVSRPGTTDSKRIDYGAIFEEYGVSPHPTGGVIGTDILITDAPPTFSWVRQNNNANDTFGLIVFEPTMGRMLDIVIPGDVTSYTLTAAQWDLLNDHTGAMKFIIRGSDTDQYTTGSYWSDSYGFNITPAPGTLALALGGVGVGLRRRRK